MFQTLRDEHELIVDYLRRDADAQHAAEAARDRPPPAAPAVEDRPNKVRLVSAEKGAPRPPPRPASEKAIAARDPEPLAPVLVVTATPLPPAEPAAAKAANHRRRRRLGSGLGRQRFLGAGARAGSAALRRSPDAPSACDRQRSENDAVELTRPLPEFGAGSEETVPFRTLFGIQELTFSSVNLKAVLLFLRGLATRRCARSQVCGRPFRGDGKVVAKA